jgi:hypothetical protein
MICTASGIGLALYQPVRSIGLGQGEAEEGSFSSTLMLHIVNNVIINRYIFL